MRLRHTRTVAALAAGLVALAAAPALATQGPDLGRCVQEVREAGLLGPQTNPGTANYVVGTEDGENFTNQLTAGVDVICGFGGGDVVTTLPEGDIFLAGTGNDSVLVIDGGTFNGGEGSDIVHNYHGGTFNQD